MRRTLVVVVWLLACGPSVGVGDEDTTGEGDISTAGPDSGVATLGTTVTSASTAATSVDGSDGDGDTMGDDAGDDVVDDGSAFVCHCPPDGGGVNIECDIWAQDCPEGEKCMPWANDGGSTWNAARCSPLLLEEPVPIGEPCQVEGSGVSGIDDCGISAMCWGVDPATNVGTCVGFCDGSEANPLCGDGLSCFIGFMGTITLCLPPCDPLAPDCGLDTCAFDLEAGGFWCVPSLHVGEAFYGEPCDDAPFTCGSEFFCAAGSHVTNCESECCTTLCDPSAGEPCPEAAFGQECLPFDEADPGLGFCGMPA